MRPYYAALNSIYYLFIATVARGSSYSDQQKNVTDVTISTSGDWAQDESLVGLLAQNPFFNDDSVSAHYISITHMAFSYFVLFT